MRSVFSLLIAAASVACLTSSNFAADPAFVPLFNGKDLTGWKLPTPVPSGEFKSAEPVLNSDGKVIAYKGTLKKSGETITLWEVKDGCIVGGGPMTHLFTERGDFTDFHLKVVVKVNDGGNSGIFFRSGLRPGVPKGFEAQVNSTHGDRVKSGSLYPNAEFGMEKFRSTNLVLDKAAHGPDEFFTEEVICEGPRVRILVNGVQTVDWTDDGMDKKRQHADGSFQKGHFAIQAHDPKSIMTYKSIEVKELKK
jgi:hypothetical protein